MTGQHRAWRLHGPGDLRLDIVATPQPAAAGIVVRVERASILSYFGKFMDGTLPYALPAFPFVPGTNAVGIVEAVGPAVLHLKPGQRVVVSPHFRADERGVDPAQVLIGLTAMGGAPADQALQALWPDGLFAEKAHVPAAVATPVPDAAKLTPADLLALSKAVVPYGGLLRGRLAPGETVIVNGATGYFGSAGVLVALAMGAARVVAAGRDRATLDALAKALGPRVVPVALTETDADTPALAAAAGGGADLALDLLGQAQSTASTASALRALRRGGRLVLMGSAAAPLAIGFREMLGNDWEVLGNFMYPKDAPARLIALAAAGLLDLSTVRTTSFAFDRLPEATAAAARMRGLHLTALAMDAV